MCVATSMTQWKVYDWRKFLEMSIFIIFENAPIETEKSATS